MKNKFLGRVVLSLALVGVLLVLLRSAPESTAPNEPSLMTATTPVAPTASASGATAVRPALLPPAPAQAQLWKETPGEPAFAAFADWTRRHAAAPDAAAKAALEAEGVALARTRLTAMADLIQTDPKRALELAVPYAVRRDLPGDVRSLLEEQINTRGDFRVAGVLPIDSAATTLPPVLRSAIINGEEYRAYTYGRGNEFVTRDNVPLNGIAVPASAASVSPANKLIQPTKIFAPSESPARILDLAELEALIERRPKKKEPVCSISGELVSSKAKETVVQLAGDLHSFCGKVHAEDWANARIAAAGLFEPGGGLSVPTAESSYTEGRKRMLCLRPYWADYPITSGMTTNAALGHFSSFSNYMFQMSYGKLVFAPLRQGSDISADILIPGSVDSYISGLGSGATDLWKAVRDVATTNYGYNLSQYDFIYYCTGGKPSASYAGLGFVGGVGFHLANGYFDAATAAHEFGHNLGLNHANFWSTSPQSIIGSGQNVEYGDNNDVMGGGGSPNQFNSRYKNYLGWITNSDIVDLNTAGSGRYRLYCFDLDNSTVGTRGLKFLYDASRNYWINFRQRKTNRALVNGVQLLWTGNGNQSSHLLDVRLKGSATDNAIVIGRTFTDTNLNFHFTPVGKGNTYPESMDVVVFTGAQAGNLPPFATIAASKLQANVGEVINFTATASDPNGDALAYFWEFSDSVENYSIDNSPAQTKSFSAAGEYTVRCVVSDMRGGKAQHTLVVRVGSPATFRIAGHVMDDRNRPLAGIQVTADASHLAYTDSDGSYTIVNLAAGSYSLSALETVSGALTLVHPYFNNPIPVGPGFSTADFVGVSGSLVIYSPLAAKTSSGWRYHDKGTDLGTAWLQPAYNDSGWSNGVAGLGYPAGALITTLISYGADANNKYPTYYFRKQFNVANPAAYTNLLLELLRDDGAAIYLNGTEVLRDNLIAGATYGTFATDNSGAAGYSQTTLPVSAIVTGTNTLAVEVHQVNATSSDIVMDVALSGLSASNVTGLNIAYLSSPADNQVFSSPTNITLSAEVFPAGAVSLVEFYVDGSKIGDDNAAPFTAVLSNPPNGTHVLRAVATVNSLLLTSPPVNIIVAPPVTPLATATLVTAGSVWSYFDKGQDLGNAWRAAAFDDSGWSNGAAKLGFGGTAVVTVINSGPAGARYPTTYFRRAFVVQDPAGLTNLTLSLLRDDGAIVYLNGVEVVRDNLPTGVAITYATLAPPASDNGSVFYSYSLPISALTPGSNSLAVEVHQTSPTSSDLALDMNISALVITNRSRGCWLVSPSAGAVVPLPGSVTLNADAVAGGTLGVSKVEFFSDGQKVGEDTAFPYSFAWANPPSGSHSLTAVATDSDGATITSDPVSISVLSPPLGTAFISFGDVWKYLDNGSNQGTNWAARLFDDRLWMAGPARLGYGGDGEITTVSFGTNANVKYITTYFRKAFTVANPATYSGLLLRLIRDDGAAVYLNGREIYRSNLQPGPLSWNSLAPVATDGANETAVFDATLPTTGLLAGTNILAVEVHQNSVGSSDLGFNLALVGLDDTNAATGIYITSPAAGAHYNSPATVSLSAFAAAPSPVTLVEYFANGTVVAQSATQPFNASWNGPASGNYSLTAVATYGTGLQLTSAPVLISIGAPPAPIIPIFQTLVPPASAWKYWDSATAVGPGWERTSFDDTAWPSANARFGWGLDGEMTVLTSGRVTHYFRRWFNVTNLGVLADLFFYLQRDDGAVVYLNGIELFRTNMPAGPVSASTLASATIDTPDETTWLEREILAAGSGLASSNLIAVELHQSSVTSSDAAFDLALYALGTSERRIYLASPANNASYASTASVLIEGGAAAGAGLGVMKVEFFADGVKIGESAAAPYKLNWSGAAFGPHTLLARMFDSLGATQDSAPVSVTVTRELFTAALIPAGSVWKYLDTGSTTQGTNWSQPGFNDASWLMGQARLGFSPAAVDGEVTTLAGQPRITYYFRKTFVTAPGLVYTNLNFRLVRDDGAVVWLNGREAYRSNMPVGAIAYNTQPSASVSGADEQTFFSTVLTITNLPAGTNIVGVEVHQFGGTSSDLGFNLELLASGYVENITPPLLAIMHEDGMIELSWPSTYTGWQAYTATTVNAPAASWLPVGVTPVLASGRYVVSLSPSGGTEYFRLIKP